MAYSWRTRLVMQYRQGHARHVCGGFDEVGGNARKRYDSSAKSWRKLSGEDGDCYEGRYTAYTCVEIHGAEPKRAQTWTPPARNAIRPPHFKTRSIRLAGEVQLATAEAAIRTYR